MFAQVPSDVLESGGVTAVVGYQGALQVKMAGLTHRAPVLDPVVGGDARGDVLRYAADILVARPFEGEMGSGALFVLFRWRIPIVDRVLPWRSEAGAMCSSCGPFGRKRVQRAEFLKTAVHIRGPIPSGTRRLRSRSGSKKNFEAARIGGTGCKRCFAAKRTSGQNLTRSRLPSNFSTLYGTQHPSSPLKFFGALSTIQAQPA